MGNLLHFPLHPTWVRESHSLNLQFSSPHFTLVVGADNGGFILKPSPSSLSLLLTSSIRILPLPQKFVRLDHLLHCSFVQASDQHQQNRWITHYRRTRATLPHHTTASDVEIDIWQMVMHQEVEHADV